jgi:hypothetical protein
MQLQELIISLNLQAQPAASIVTTLNAKTVPFVDNKLYGPSKVRKVLNNAQNLAFSNGFTTKAATDSVAADALAEFRTVGLDFSDADNIAIISGLGLTNPVRNRVLEIGNSLISPWFADGRKVDVTLLEVQAALLEIRKDALVETARNTFQQYRVTVAAWDGTGTPPVMGG